MMAVEKLLDISYALLIHLLSPGDIGKSFSTLSCSMVLNHQRSQSQ